MKPRDSSDWTRISDLDSLSTRLSGSVSRHLKDLDALLSDVAEIVAEEAPGVDGLALFMPSHVSGELECIFSQGSRANGEHTVLLGIGAVGRCAQTRSPQIEDCATNSLRSTLAIPIVFADGLTGALQVFSRERNAFGERESEMIERVAALLTPALDNARDIRRLSRRNKLLQMLIEVSRDLATILEPARLMESVQASLRKLVPFDAYSIYLTAESGSDLVLHCSFRFDGRQKMESVLGKSGVIAEAVGSKKPVLVTNTATSEEFDATREGVMCELAVPLLSADGVLGALHLESDSSELFRADDVDIVCLFASQLAASLEAAQLHKKVAEQERTLEEDLDAARRLQNSLLLPSPRKIGGVDVFVNNAPARFLSGDFYDFYEFSGSAGVVVADVSGKGAAAALFGALVSGLMRSQIKPRQKPSLLFEKLNQLLTQRKDAPSVFAVATLVQWNVSDYQLRLAGSGLPPPLIVSASRVRQLPVSGIPLGLLPGVSYEGASVRLEPSETLAIASDGILERFNKDGEEFGANRLGEALQRATGSIEEVGAAVLEEVERWADGVEPHDDQTLLILRRR